MSQGRRVFLDASVLVAAARSPQGGSALALEVCRGRLFRAVVSRRVLLEADPNMAAKLGEEELVRFYRQLAALDPKAAEPPGAEAMERYAQLIDRRDVHVLAAAVASGAEFLLTPDRRRFLTQALRQAGLPLTVATPGDFLRRIAS